MPRGEVPIDGDCAPGFEPVREAFLGNFAAGDLGASCAVTVGGRLVVDLWGGYRDPARRTLWERGTIVNVWSTTKMLAALCIAMLHERGVVSIDSPVAEYWPEFAENGKAEVLVRHVLAHTAGLPVFDDPPDEIEVFGWEECCRRLAGQAPRWQPGRGSGYHAETQGWLLGEIVRRADGRTLGTFFREEVAEPLGLDLHIGLDDRHFPRVADMCTLHAEASDPAGPEPRERRPASGTRSATLVNTAAWRRAEFPAANAHGNARSIALAMVPLANGGRAGDRRLLSAATIERAFEVQADGVDRVIGRRLKLGIGFGLHCESTPVGVNDRTLWWAGWGGSMCVVDVENRLTVAYAMNRMLADDHLRAASVILAAHAARAAEQ